MHLVTLLSGTKIASKRPEIFRQQKKPKIINDLCMVGHAPRNSLDMKTLLISPQSILWRKILVAQVFNLCQRRLNSHGHFPTPEDEKMWNSRPRLFFFKSRRGRLLHITQGFVTVKPAATFFIRPNIGCQNLTGHY
jgi:hypothetical protein